MDADAASDKNSKSIVIKGAFPLVQFADVDCGCGFIFKQGMTFHASQGVHVGDISSYFYKNLRLIKLTTVVKKYQRFPYPTG